MCGGSNKVKETESEKALAETSIAKWQSYKQNFRPIEDKFISEVQNLNSDEVRNQTVKQAVNPVRSEFSKAINNDMKQIAASGVDPSSGKAQGALQDRTLNASNTEAQVINKAEETATDRFVTGLSNTIAMGHGQAGQAMIGMADVSQSAQQFGINNAVSDMHSKQNIADGVMAGAGAFARYQQEPSNNDNKFSATSYTGGRGNM